jgi:hypothetical protein
MWFNVPRNTYSSVSGKAFRNVFTPLLQKKMPCNLTPFIKLLDRRSYRNSVYIRMAELNWCCRHRSPSEIQTSSSFSNMFSSQFNPKYKKRRKAQSKSRQRHREKNCDSRLRRLSLPTANIRAGNLLCSTNATGDEIENWIDRK